VGELVARQRAGTCSTSATSARKSIEEVKQKLIDMGLALKDSPARV